MARIADKKAGKVKDKSVPASIAANEINQHKRSGHILSRSNANRVNQKEVIVD